MTCLALLPLRLSLRPPPFPGVPCAHTRTVGFETTHKDYQHMQAAAAAGGRRKLNLTKYAIGGAAGLVLLAGLGVGAAFAFGDIGATAAKVGSGGEMVGCCGVVGGRWWGGKTKEGVG